MAFASNVFALLPDISRSNDRSIEVIVMRDLEARDGDIASAARRASFR
jgi:hypothetical protein